MIQGCGHGDLVEDERGNFWMVHLAFRQIHQWMTFHITGREVCLVPVTFQENGWFTAGVGGITPTEVETDRIPDSVVQSRKLRDTFSDTRAGVDWVFLRRPHGEDFSFSETAYRLYPTNLTLGEKQDSPLCGNTPTADAGTDPLQYSGSGGRGGHQPVYGSSTSL